ncbi:MAG: hypothetical protein V5A68_06385 [Candidatus Thermoplasmatota archaeon]
MATIKIDDEKLRRFKVIWELAELDEEASVEEGVNLLLDFALEETGRALKDAFSSLNFPETPKEED